MFLAGGGRLGLPSPLGCRRGSEWAGAGRRAVALGGRGGLPLPAPPLRLCCLDVFGDSSGVHRQVPWPAPSLREPVGSSTRTAPGPASTCKASTTVLPRTDASQLNPHISSGGLSALAEETRLRGRRICPRSCLALPTLCVRGAQHAPHSVRGRGAPSAIKVMVRGQDS